jgi:hypothetical protein
MRSLLITAALSTAAIALSGCPYQEPAPGPQSAAGAALHFGGAFHARQ